VDVVNMRLDSSISGAYGDVFFPILGTEKGVVGITSVSSGTSKKSSLYAAALLGNSASASSERPDNKGR
jgi:hypothetical protein